MNFKLYIPIILFALCACTNKQKVEDPFNKKEISHEEKLPLNNSPNKINSTNSIKNKLIGTWVSTIEIRNGIIKNLKGIHTLILMEDGKFRSFYEPSNFKDGDWYLVNDTIRLEMKAVDDYKIIKLTDSIMIAQLLFITQDSVIIEYRRKSQLPPTSGLHNGGKPRV